jgi:cytochrome c peroxidase
MKLFGIIILLFLGACNFTEEKASSFYQPEDFPLAAFPSSNKFSDLKMKIGRQLFFDPSLSSNLEVSCASCHLQSKAFTDGVDLSAIGVTKKALQRHTPALINLAWMENGLFWDGGAKNLESLIFGPLMHPDEMGADLDQVLNYVRGNQYYADAIKEAFAIEEIKVQYVAKSIAQYLRILVSDQSKYDSVRRELATFNLVEQKGYELFQMNCSSCHQEPLLTDNQFHNNGIDSVFSNSEEEGVYLGRFRISHDETDIGKYKTPTLRNVALTAPYMHDGRFGTLEEVLNHYAEGVNLSPTLDSSLLRQGRAGIVLTQGEKVQLMAFLNSLTDFQFIENGRYGNTIN